MTNGATAYSNGYSTGHKKSQMPGSINGHTNGHANGQTSGRAVNMAISSRRWMYSILRVHNLPKSGPLYLTYYQVGSELNYLTQWIQSTCISGDGAFTQKCRHLLEATLGVDKVLLTTSCTHALEMAALLLKIQPGDEVIVPSFTFVSTVNAFVSARRPPHLLRHSPRHAQSG